MNDGIDFVSTSNASDGIDFQPTGDKNTPWSEVPGNALKDIKNVPSAVLEAAKPLADPLGLGEAALTQSTKPIEKAAMRGIDTVKGLGHEIAQTVSHPIETFKEHPVNTIMNAAPLVAPFFGGPKGIAKGEVPPVESAAEVPKAPVIEKPPVGEAPKPVELPPEVQNILDKVKNVPPPETSLQGTMEKVKGAIPQDVQDFVKKKATGIGETPVSSSTMGEYAQRHANNMTMKSLGAAPGQIRKIGIDEASKLAQYARDKGIVSGKVGEIGAEQKINQIHSDAGRVVGDMRATAAQRGATHDLNSLIQDIHGKLGSKYESGIHSGEQSQYLKALQQISKTPMTPDKIAQTVTELFQEAKGLDRLKQPSGAMADVARELRSANERLMQKYLDPKELNVYHNALEDYGATTQLKEFTKRKESTEMGGRLPPGMGVGRAVLQKALDSFGYRTQAQVVGNLAKWLKENPSATMKAKDIFRKYVDEAAEAMDEGTEALNQ